MATETEAKFRLDDPLAIRRVLEEVNATPTRRVLEHNTYFDDQACRLREEDRGLRIRLEQAEDGAGVAILTYKGPRQPGPFKVRPEHETVVDSPQAAAAILAGLGYLPVLRFQKRREYFDLEGAQICLDELPELGWFLEIEARDEQEVQRLRQRLGLGETPTVTETYTALIARHLEGTGATELKFP